MKRTLRNLIIGILGGFCVLMLLSFAASQDQKTGAPWVVPAKYKAMKNPQKGDPAALNTGKMLYTKHCKSCHGGSGAGDGPKANSMKTKVNSFKDSKFQAQNDGDLYFESFVGRDEMPNFEKKILDDEERWAIVSFIRTLK